MRQRLFALAATAVAAGAVATGAAGQHATTSIAACQKGYYKNVSGHCVHKPASTPVGATAKCRDGTYSYSEHASGTCSHHSGVARWIHHP
jgi:hypothetical protein